MVAASGCASSATRAHSPAAASSEPPTTTADTISTSATTTAPTTDIFDIPSEAMAPTLQPGDKVHVNLHFASLARGDIVIFHKPPNDYSPSITYLIKRIVGVPGETISASGGTVEINGQPLKEPWLPAGVVTDAFGPVSIPSGDWYVLGDNRSNSADSRVIGPISGDLIIGVADAIVYPPSRAGSILPHTG